MRGGGGGEGALGVRFNVVTNAEDVRAREKTLMRTGPRVSCNVQDPWRIGVTRYGEHPDGKIDILSGKVRPYQVAPQRSTAHALLRPDEVVLRTRPW